MQLSDLIGPHDSSDTTSAIVTVRGKLVTLRLTSALTRAKIEAAMPRPKAPMVQDPNKGSLAPLVPDESDPEYQNKMDLRDSEMAIVEVAIAMQLELQSDGRTPDRWDDCCTPEHRASWARRAIDQLGSILTETEIGMMRAEMARTLMRLLPPVVLGN